MYIKKDWSNYLLVSVLIFFKLKILIFLIIIKVKGKNFENELKTTVKDQDIYDLFIQILNSNKEKTILDHEKIKDNTFVIVEHNNLMLMF